MRTVEEIENNYPKDADEWWALFEAHKDELLELTKGYHPWYRECHHHPITAPGAEAVCQIIRKQIADSNDKDPEVRFNQHLQAKSDEMVGLLNEVWFGVPESVEAHGIPGFGVLCDLCSEGYVLQPFEETEE